MYKLATIGALIAVAVSVGTASAASVHRGRVVVPKPLRLRSTKRLPNEASAALFGAPPYAQFLRIPGTNRYRVRSMHGGLDD